MVTVMVLFFVCWDPSNFNVGCSGSDTNTVIKNGLRLGSSARVLQNEHDCHHSMM